MLRHVAEPVDAGGLELGVRVKTGNSGSVGWEAAGNGARDERSALLLQPFDQRPLFLYERIDLCRLAVQKVGDGALLIR